MDINFSDVVSVLSFIAVIYGAWWASRAINKRVPSQNALDDNKAMEIMQGNVERAIARANAAEKRAEAVEADRDKDRLALVTYKKAIEEQREIERQEINKLKDDFEEWKKKQRFLLAFTVLFTDEPEIQDVKVRRDRRKYPSTYYAGEERRQDPP
jgi:hypothetical protein